MKLLVIGDYTLFDPTVDDVVKSKLDLIHSRYPIDKIVTFDEDGVDAIATEWAFDNEIDFVVFDSKKTKYPLSRQNQPNSYLKNIVTGYDIDTFLFYFFENNLNGHEQDISGHRATIRNFYRRATNHFKTKMVISSHKIPPI